MMVFPQVIAYLSLQGLDLERRRWQRVTWMILLVGWMDGGSLFLPEQFKFGVRIVGRSSKSLL